MKPNMLLKLCAVAGSLLLAAGFVSYRAGALNSIRKPGPAVIPRRSPRNTFPVTPGETGGEQILHSSKSGAIFIEPQTTSPPVPPPQHPATDAPVIFGGSKSLMAPPPSEN